jgi:hypothetical protein
MRPAVLDADSRAKAGNHRCGQGPWLCPFCALIDGIISKDLAVCLQDSDFALAAPLTRQRARGWTPPSLRFSG